MPKALDLIGQRFGMLTVVEKTDRRYSSGKIVLRCKCDCGNETYSDSWTLKSGIVVSCGCSKRLPDLKGRRFGRLTVIDRIDKLRDYKVVNKCLCDCGNIVYVTSKSLVHGITKSCGCLSAITSMVWRLGITHIDIPNYIQNLMLKELEARKLIKILKQKGSTK